MSHLVKIIIISLFLLYLLYTYTLIKIEIPIFISLSSININDINFNLLLLPENQIHRINMYYINMNKSVERKSRYLDRMSKFNNYNSISQSLFKAILQKILMIEIFFKIYIYDIIIFIIHSN